MANEEFPEGVIEFDQETGQIILKHGDGKEDRFLVECEVEVESERYIVLVRAEDAEEEEVMGVVFQVDVDEDGEEIWKAVDDEETLAKVEEVMVHQEEEE